MESLDVDQTAGCSDTDALLSDQDQCMIGDFSKQNYQNSTFETSAKSEIISGSINITAF